MLSSETAHPGFPTPGTQPETCLGLARALRYPLPQVFNQAEPERVRGGAALPLFRCHLLPRSPVKPVRPHPRPLASLPVSCIPSREVVAFLSLPALPGVLTW